MDIDKNILITPSTGLLADPSIIFTGQDANPITLSVLDSILSFSGSSGQLFSISDDLTGTIFSVNDISGIPSIEVIDAGTIILAEFTGNVLVGTTTDNGTDKFQINGDIIASNLSGVNSGDNSTNTLYSTLETNVDTALSTGTVNDTSYGITSDGGTDDVIIAQAIADTSSGVMSGTDKGKLDGIEALAEVNDINTVIDADYVHTDNNFTDEDKLLASSQLIDCGTATSIYVGTQNLDCGGANG